MKFLSFIFLWLIAVSAQATNIVETVTLTPRVRVVWDRNVETNLGGYFVYTTISNTTWFYETTNNEAFILRDLLTNSVQTNAAYTLFVTAFNTDGIESDPSDTLTLTFVWPSGVAPPVNLGIRP